MKHDQAKQHAIVTDVCIAIMHALLRHGIEVPAKCMAVHLHGVDPAQVNEHAGQCAVYKENPNNATSPEIWFFTKQEDDK